MEVAAFLRERRSSLAPTKQELKDRPRRRVRGLTRQEVAARAGVSFTWYSWLEMGRDVRATASTLNSIARALQLSDDEASYLLALADGERAERSLGQTGDVGDATLRTLVEGFTDGPAFVVNRRWDIIVSNGHARIIYGYVPSKSLRQNVLCRLVRDRDFRELHTAPDEMLQAVTGLIRYNYADDPQSPELTELVHELADDERFVRAWAKYSVQTFAPIEVAVKQRSGNLRLMFVATSVGRKGHETLVFHIPLDERTRKILRELTVANDNSLPAAIRDAEA